MKPIWTALVLLAALINLAPVAGAFSAERMSALYGVAIADPDLEILMRHRAVLFGVVGGLLVAMAFRPALRATGYAVGFASMISFVLLAGLVGDYGDGIRRILLVDGVGIAALAGAAAIQLVGLRPPPA